MSITCIMTKSISEVLLLQPTGVRNCTRQPLCPHPNNNKGGCKTRNCSPSCRQMEKWLHLSGALPSYLLQSSYRATVQLTFLLPRIECTLHNSFLSSNHCGNHFSLFIHHMVNLIHIPVELLQNFYPMSPSSQS